MKKILLIEDDPFLIDIYTTKFKEETGFSVEVAKGGDEGLRKAEGNPPDLIILDIVLPQIDGWEILKKIRENKELNKVKIIIISNLGQKEEVEKGIKMGAAKYLIKAHYTPSEIVEEIKEILK